MGTHQTAHARDVGASDTANVPLETAVSIDTRMLKVGEAAKAIGVHKRTVYDWIEKGLVETRYLPSGVTLVVMASVVKTHKRALAATSDAVKDEA